MAGGVILAQLALNAAEIRHIDASSMQALQRAEDAGRATVDALRRAEASPFEMCSEGDLTILRNITYANSYVADLGRIEQGVVRCTALWGKLDRVTRLPEPHYRPRGGFSVWSHQEVLQTHYQSNLVALNHSLAIASPSTFDLNRFYQDVSLRITNGSGTHTYAERAGLRYNPSGAIELLPAIDITECSPDMGLCAQATAHLHWFALAHPLSFFALMAGSFLLGALAYLLYLRLRRNQGVLEKLREGIANDEIVLLYQPIVCVRDLSLKGYEALARWRPADEPEIGPDIFVPLAAQNRLSTALAKVVLARALREMQDLLQADPALMLAVNTEVADIEDTDFIEFALDLTAATPGLRPQLHLEVTERADIRSATFTQNIELLRKAGFAIWIDDFGTGSANLSHLSYAQFDGIKIDRLFTSALSTGSPLRSVVPNLLRLAAFASPMAAVQAQATDAQRQAYDIPAGPLDQSLNSFARRAGVLLSFDPAITRDRQSAGLAGRYTVDEGFAALLNGSPLQAIRNADGGYTVAAPAAATGSNANAVLPTVTITESADPTAPYAGGLVARGGSLGVLGTASVMDSPFSTTNYTSQGIEDVQARAIGDVIANDASVRNTNGNGGFGDSYQIRGFTMSANDVAFNGLYGMVPLTRMPISMVERIEVLKGPGTLMYGMGPAGGVGGAVNLIPKRAHEDPISSVTATYLSNSQFGLKADLGRRFGEQQEWGIRVNALYADGNTGLSGSNQQQSMGSVGLDYNGGRVRWSLDAYTQHEDARNFRPQFSISSLVMPDAPSGKTNLYPGTTLQSDDKAVATRLEYDINDQLTAYGAVGYHVASSAQSWPSATILNAAGDTAALSNGYYDQKVVSTSADVGMRARFNTAGIKHTVMLGVNMLDQQTDYFFLSQSSNVTSNLYRPVALPTVTGARGAPTPQSQIRLTSVALTDTLSLADDRLRITAGLRRQQVYSHSLADATQTSNKTAISPVLGVVVKPVQNVSLYANYTAALSAGGFTSASDGNPNQLFPPYKSKQVETGAKIDWGRITTTAAVFQIEQANSSTTLVNGVSTTTQDGRNRVRGLELAAYGELQRGLRFNASGTFFDAKQYHTDNGTNDGKDVGAIPNSNFNLGLDWDAPWLQGLALNTRVTRTGSMWYSNENKLKVPGWTRVDIGARYITRAAGQVVTYRANIENLFDKNYWLMQNGYVGTSSGRTLVLSAQVDF